MVKSKVITISYFSSNKNLNDHLQNDKPLRLSINDPNIRLQENNFELALKDIKFDNAGTYRCIAFNEFVTGYVNRTLTVVGMCNYTLFFCYFLKI